MEQGKVIYKEVEKEKEKERSKERDKEKDQEIPISISDIRYRRPVSEVLREDDFFKGACQQSKPPPRLGSGENAILQQSKKIAEFLQSPIKSGVRTTFRATFLVVLMSRFSENGG